MALKDLVPQILNHIEVHAPEIEHNEQLFQVFEGDLMTYVLEDLRQQLSARSFDTAKGRVAPINFLKHLVLKLSKLYSEAPVREVVEEDQTDMELLEFYEKAMQLDSFMGDSNEFFNLFKNCALEPFVDEGAPKIRVIPASRFLVFSDDRVNPLKETVFIKFMGKQMRPTGISNVRGEPQMVEKNVFWLYTDEEFLAIDEDGATVSNDMLQNPEGINPFGKIPFVYINRSRHNLIPVPDTDLLKMTKVLAVILSDMNFAVMMQAFSIIFGIDIDPNNLEMSPNSLWIINSDKTSGNRPEIGTIKPEVDVTKVIELIIFELSAWLQSRNIRPGAIGKAGADSSASGVNLIVQNMDTTEDKKMQIPFFKQAEFKLWNLISEHMHPVWVEMGMIEERRLFSDNFQVMVRFKDPKPFIAFDEKIANQRLLLDAGLTTRKRAIKELDPEMKDEDIDDLLKEIDEDDSPFRVDLPSSEANTENA